MFFIEYNFSSISALSDCRASDFKLRIMERARRLLISNLARNAGVARQRMALSAEAVSRLTGIAIAQISAVECGDGAIELSLDDLTSLALFLGLTVRGEIRIKTLGSS